MILAKSQTNVIDVFNISSMNEVRKCVESIRAGHSIIINYRNINYDIGCRFYNFMDGCRTALNIECIKISNNIFLYSGSLDSIKRNTFNSDFSNTIRLEWGKPIKS